MERENPDIILLQEIKCEEKSFPFDQFFDAGYNSYINGQKTYNGVAILSKTPLENVSHSFPAIQMARLEDTTFNNEARYIEGYAFFENIPPLRVASVYVPNGAPISSSQTDVHLTETNRFKYKMAFLDDLAHHMKTFDECDIGLVSGDYNIAIIEDDVPNPKTYGRNIGFLPAERAKMLEVIEKSNTCDVFRLHHPVGKIFSWWDYRRASFSKNIGMRIDYTLINKPFAERVVSSSILTYYRELEKTSDHAPHCYIIS